MKQYSLNTNAGFQGVYEGDCIEEAIFQFLDDVGIQGFYYDYDSKRLEATFVLSEKNQASINEEVLHDFAEQVATIKELFKNSQEVPKGYVVYWDSMRNARVIDEEDLVCIDFALADGFDQF